MSAVCVNKVEYHLGHLDEELLQYCGRQNVTLLAAAGPFHYPAPPDSAPALRAAASAHGVGVEQVRRRYQVQRGVPVVLGTREEATYASLLKPLFDFALTAAEMAALAAL